MTSQRPKPKQLFVLRKGTDGVDNTIEVVCRETNLSIARFSYWSHERRAIKAATAFASALKAVFQDDGYIFGSNFETSFDAIHLKYYSPAAFCE